MREVRNILIGMDISRESSQLAYYDRKAQDVVSVPTKVGTNLYAFPTKLAKMKDKDEWHFGAEAEYFVLRGEASAVPDLLDAAVSGEAVTIDGISYSPDTLLAVFIRESLKMLGVPDIVRGTRGICLTSPVLDGGLAVSLKKALQQIGFTDDQTMIEDYKESFYYYGYSQKPSIWSRSMALVSFHDNEAELFTMSEQKDRKPYPVTVELKARITLPEDDGEKDLRFSEFIRQELKKDAFSAVFITGRGFSGDWAKSSVAVLCEGGRRVFEGDNLFVRGACWAALEKCERHQMGSRVYLGPDLVTSGISMDLIVDGVQRTVTLIHPGRNWFENAASIQFIPDGRKDITLSMTRLGSPGRRSIHLKLPGLPARPNRTTRLSLRLSCTSGDHVHVEAEDLGFGELFPASHKVWTFDLNLSKEAESIL